MKKITLLIISIFILFVSLATSTYAWLSIEAKGSIDNFEMKVTDEEYKIQIKTFFNGTFSEDFVVDVSKTNMKPLTTTDCQTFQTAYYLNGELVYEEADENSLISEKYLIKATNTFTKLRLQEIIVTGSECEFYKCLRVAIIYKDSYIINEGELDINLTSTQNINFTVKMWFEGTDEHCTDELKKLVDSSIKVKLVLLVY